MSRRKAIALLLLLMLSLLAVGAEAQRTRRRRQRRAPRAVPVRTVVTNSQMERAGDQSLEVGCRTYCSDEVRPRTGDAANEVKPRRSAVAEITWRASGTQLQPQDLESQAALQGVEVTVYKDGFSRGRFANLFSVREGQSFSMQDSQNLNTRIPGLDRLTILNVRPVGSRDATDRAFDGPSNMVAVEIEGLEPGLNYFWRVTSAAADRKLTSEIIRCQAPTCPVDFQPGSTP